MENNIIQFYNAYDEDSRLQSTKAKKLEFITTTSILDEYIQKESKTLELGSGTGIYSFYFAEKGNHVTATDITPKHVEMMKLKFSETPNTQMDIRVADATNLTDFEDGIFDVVLCLGPMYHLVDIEQQHQCIAECLRVLKPGGILAIAYISRFNVFPYLVKGDRKFLTKDWVDRILDHGFTKASEDDCFWTDAYFHTPLEIKNLLNQYNTEFVDHVGTDGLAPLLSHIIDDLTDDEYEAWIRYHLRTCREESMIGSSNHALYVCRKN